MQNRYAVLVSTLVLFLVSGCASIFNGPNQMVAFNTDPENATVAVDGVAMGKTPCVLPVPRKGWDKTISFTKPGFKTVNYRLRNTLSGALWGNVLVPIVGTTIDAISGRGGGYQPSVSILLIPGDGIVYIDPKEEAKKAKEKAKLVTADRDDPNVATADAPEVATTEPPTDDGS